MKSELYEFSRDDAYRFQRHVGIEAYPRGNELIFKTCPFCGGGQGKGKDLKTFSINLDTGAWNCKRGKCGRSGNMITLMQEFEGFSLGDGIDDFYLKRERFKRFVRKPIESKDKAVEYMESRGIPETITRKYEITIQTGTDNVLVFPFIDDKDEMWFVKYRNITFEKGTSKGSKEWCEKDRKPILFGMNHCNFENRTLVMTEGQIDSLSCAAAGIENAVSVPLGKNGFTWTPYCFNFLGRFDELIVFGDYENGEISLLEEMRTRFKSGQVKHVRPEDYKDCKDANEILMKYGKEAVRECVANAEPCPVIGLKRMADVQRVRLSDRERMQTGIDELDKKCPFVFGELIVLTGAAGDGKSTLASQWATMAINQGYPSMIYSGEMPEWMVKNWIDFQIAGAHNLNQYSDIEEGVYTKIVEWPAYRDGLYIYDVDETESDKDAIFRILLEGIQQYGIRFVVIDNLMTAMDFDGHLELNEAQTQFTKRLAKIAQNHDIIIILIVHPRKGRGFGTFSNDDISGSSNIVNRAHKTIRYSRPDKEFVDKNGYKWEKEELGECPIRIMTVLKDRISGHILSKGVPLYFEEDTKRISATGTFEWRLGWENNNGFYDVDDIDEIPF